MGPILRLSLRQLTGRWRVAFILLLAVLGVAMAVIVSVVTTEEEKAHGGVIDVFFDGLMIGAMMPIVMMALATASFGNELEDRTLNYIVLKPVARWVIVLSKVLAPIAVGAPLVIVTGVVISILLLGGDARAAVAVAVALGVGVMAYAAIFTWAGLMSTSALAFAIVYVFVWEGLISTFLGGVRYLSVRGYSLAILHGVDEKSFEEFGERVIELPAAVAGAVGVTIVFFWLTVYRLRRMDVP